MTKQYSLVDSMEVCIQLSSRKYGRAWKRIRDKYVAKHPYCECCGAKVEEVHHITPISQGGRHTEKNLMSVCRECHKYLHERRANTYRAYEK